MLLTCNVSLALHFIDNIPMHNIDSHIQNFDRALRIMTGLSAAARPSPAANMQESQLSEAERRNSAGLMRINHVGEVCAQALYEAQGQFTRSPTLRMQFKQAGQEEMEHLAWTAERLAQLGARPSLLNPLWYLGAYGLGALAAKAGDAQSLGFVVETERQVEAHLASHLSLLPEADHQSRAIVQQMRQDEAQHGAAAQALGASTMPSILQGLMAMTSKLMTRTAYHM
jgi:ubiquinone biosynthesis monooxygenase Coq7